VVGVLFYVDGLERRLDSSMFGNPLLQPGKLDRFYDLPNRNSGRSAASLVYHELGVRIGYVGPDGSPIVFEPTPEDEKHRATSLTLQRNGLVLHQQLERHALFLQLAAYFHLGSLPLVAFLYLLRTKRRLAT